MKRHCQLVWKDILTCSSRRECVVRAYVRWFRFLAAVSGAFQRERAWRGSAGAANAGDRLQRVCTRGVVRSIVGGTFTFPTCLALVEQSWESVLC